MASINPTTTIGTANIVGPWNSVPAHFRPTTGYVASGTALSDAQVHFVPITGLRKSCFYFTDIDNNDTWDASSTIKPPRGLVCAFWLPDVDTTDDECPRVTSANAVHFVGRANGSGWLLVFSRG